MDGKKRKGKLYKTRYKTTRPGSIMDNIVRQTVFYADSKKEGEVLYEELVEKAGRIQNNEIEYLVLQLYAIGYILDVGCGDRKIGHIGIDIEKKEDVDIVADACYLPFREHTFDSVISHHVIEHIPNYDLALKEMQRLSRGVIIIVVPRKEHSYVNEGHLHHFTKDEWEKLFHSGFDIEDSFTIGVSNIFICCKWVKTRSPQNL